MPIRVAPKRQAAGVAYSPDSFTDHGAYLVRCAPPRSPQCTDSWIRCWEWFASDGGASDVRSVVSCTYVTAWKSTGPVNKVHFPFEHATSTHRAERECNQLIIRPAR